MLTLFLFLLLLSLSGCLNENNGSEYSLNINSPHEEIIDNGDSWTEIQDEGSKDQRYDDNENEIFDIEGEYVIFEFYDNITNCSLDGEFSFNGINLGKTEDGRFLLFKDVFFNLTNNPENITITYWEDQYLDINCLKADLSSCYSGYEDKIAYFCFYFEGHSYNYTEHTLLESACDLTDTYIYFLNNQRQLFKPETVSHYLDTIRILNDTEEDLETIHRFVNQKIRYWHPGYLSEWQEPLYTLTHHGGNCADHSVAVISLMRAYDPSLDCYMMLIPSHGVPFCHLGDKLRIYEQENEYYMKELQKTLSEDEARERIGKFLSDYFKSFYIPKEDRTVYGILNDEEYHEFMDIEEFIDWVILKWQE